MKELSLNILDIAMNSVKAGAKHIGIALEQDGDKLVLRITDDGCGMDEQTLRGVTDPFYTTRTTRPVGMGLSLLKQAAELTGGCMKIESVSEKISAQEHGTTVEALFYPNHIDAQPLGDVVSTLITLIHGSPDIDFVYKHRVDDKVVELDTEQLRGVLGDEVSLAQFEVLQWIEGYLKEQYEAMQTA